MGWWAGSTAAGDSCLNGGTSEERWEEGNPLESDERMMYTSMIVCIVKI